jgi:IS30 family transposase
MPGTPLASRDRDEVHHALTANPHAGWAEIGRLVERHPTTIMREVDSNGGRCKYRPAAADKRAIKYRRRPRARFATVSFELRSRIENELRLGRSPVAIVLDADGVAGRPCATRATARHCRTSWTGLRA